MGKKPKRRSTKAVASSRFTELDIFRAAFVRRFGGVAVFSGDHHWDRDKFGAAVVDQTFSATIAESAPSNLLTNPSAFDHADWTKTNCTVSANATTDPDSGSAADKIIATAASGFHTVTQYVSKAAAEVVYDFAVYAKQDELNIVQINIDAGGTGNGYFRKFAISGSGTLDSAAAYGSGVTGGTDNITDVGGGWFLCEMNGVTVSAAHTSIGPIIGLTSGGNPNFAGDGTSGEFIYQAVLVAA